MRRTERHTVNRIMDKHTAPRHGGIRLSPRLRKIAALVPDGCTVADIGTDHAYIPAYLAENGIIRHAIASDIRSGPLARAEATVKRCRLEGTVETRLGAGLERLAPGEAEVIIIAGMGGVLISEILEAAPETVSGAKLLILQPMTAVLELREYLSGNAYTVSGEYLVRETGKMYNIIAAVPGGGKGYSLCELYLGRGLDRTSPELYGIYRDREIRRLERAADGLKKSADEKNAVKYNEITHIINELKRKEGAENG